MSTYNHFNDEQSVNNNAVLAVFAIVLAALIVIGFMMSQAAAIPPTEGSFQHESMRSFDSNRGPTRSDR